jgi:hypothetical protein
MKNTIKLLFTIILLLAISNVKAQSHDMSPGSTCKLIKTKVNSESHICPACAAKDKKEKEAKVAENKRRDDAIVAKAKAENDARQAAFKEEQRLKQEQYKKERDEKVVIDFPKNNMQQNTNSGTKTASENTILISKNDNSKSKLFSKTEYINNQRWSLILNEIGEVILKSTDFSGYDWKENYLGINLNKMVNDIPNNLAIVYFGGSMEYNIINSKGEKQLDEKNITQIRYCGNNFFMYFTGNGTMLDKFVENSYRLADDKMILYDHQLKKKYVYEKIADNINCKINNRCQIGRISQLSVSESLFTFTREKCTHKLVNEGGSMVGEDEHYNVGLDRIPKQIGTTNDARWGSIHK